VQVDRKAKAIRNADAVEKKFGVPPELIPDYLALVGDSADGYPGLDGIGPKGASSLLLRYGRIEQFPDETLGNRRALALLFKELATLKTDAPVLSKISELKWLGPTTTFPDWSERLGPKVIARSIKAAADLRDSKTTNV
jgi:5'-3' exonuclease